MCIPAAYGMQSPGAKAAPGAAGYRLDQAQRDAAAKAGGGTDGAVNPTILTGAPRNTDVDAIRKTTFMGV